MLRSEPRRIAMPKVKEDVTEQIGLLEGWWKVLGVRSLCKLQFHVTNEIAKILSVL